MKRENFYRRDPGRALAGMQGMTLEERGVYNTVLDLLYLTWRPIEDNPAYIAAHCGCAVQKVNPILRRLVASGKLVRFDEAGQSYISNPHFEDERQAVKGACGSRSGRAKVGEKSAEVAENSASVEENAPLLFDEIKQTQQVNPLEKTRVEKSRPLPQKPPEGAFSPEFTKAWNAYPEEGRATTNQADSFAEWQPMATEVGAGPLLACVRAFTASAAVVGPKAKAAPKFTVWLKRRRFETFLKLAGAVAESGAWPGPSDIWSAVVAKMGGGRVGEDWARSYLGRCEVAGRTLYTTSSTVERGLRSEVGRELSELGVTLIIGKAAA
jgi:hypothetical protein